MRYFIDTEFIENGKTIDLISIGIVSEDGREYYAQSVDFNNLSASPWVKEHVFPQLVHCPYKQQGRVSGAEDLTDSLFYHSFSFCRRGRCEFDQCPWRNRDQMKADILAFMDIEKYGPPELWGYYSAYDHVAFCQIFGKMIDLPAGFPMLPYDLRQWLDMNGMKDICQPDDSVHNALEDAHWVAATYYAHKKENTRA